MKYKFLLIFIISFILSSCAQEKKGNIYIIFKQNKDVKFELKKFDTIHKYRCQIKKHDSSNMYMTFNVCGIIFTYKKSNNSIEKIKKENIYKNNLVTFNNFFKLKNPQSMSIEKNLFFLEEINENYYLKYPVKWSNDFFENGSKKKYYDKFDDN